MDLQDLARRYCLQNAVQHGGTCAPKSLVGRIMGAHPEFRSDPPAVMAALVEAGAGVNAMDPDAQRDALAAEAPDLLEERKRERQTGLKPLPGDTDHVVLRFAPNPNGPLSLGHARGVAIMSAYAKQYQADLVLRFDDTDAQVKPPLMDEARGWDGYAMCLEDFTWLGGQPTRVVKASDRLDVYYEHARALIAKGGAYVCECDAEAWRAMKNRGKPCEHRDQETSKDFEAMVAGDVRPGQAVLRVKTDIQHRDPALRDWTAFRIAKAVHPRAERNEIPDRRCWPLLDFQSAVEDHLQGVTHIIRGKDLMDSTRKQQFLYKHMGWKYPETLYWGRVSVHGFGRFSTSWMRQKIEDGTFQGWDDPRLPTLGALRRRGYDPAAVAAFWLSLGISEKDIAVSMDNLEAEDAKLQDDRAPRYFFVPEPQEIPLRGVGDRVASPLLHPSHPDRGHREVVPGDRVLIPEAEAGVARVRLKDLGNVLLPEGTFDGDAMDRSVPIIQWVRADAPPFKVLRPEGERLDTIVGNVEAAALERIGEVVQFERFGFVRIEDQETGIWLH